MTSDAGHVRSTDMKERLQAELIRGNYKVPQRAVKGVVLYLPSHDQIHKPVYRGGNASSSHLNQLTLSPLLWSVKSSRGQVLVPFGRRLLEAHWCFVISVFIYKHTQREQRCRLNAPKDSQSPGLTGNRCCSLQPNTVTLQSSGAPPDIYWPFILVCLPKAIVEAVQCPLFLEHPF